MLSALLRMNAPFKIDEDRFTRRDITIKYVVGPLECNRLAGQHERILATPHAQRPNSEWIAERQNAMARNQGDDCI